MDGKGMMINHLYGWFVHFNPPLKKNKAKETKFLTKRTISHWPLSVLNGGSNS